MAPQKASAPVPSTIRSSEAADGKETFTTGLSASLLSTLPSEKPKAPAPPPPEEEDDPSVSVEPGTVCRRKGCGVKFVNDEESRGDDVVCTYHPSPVSSGGVRMVFRSLICYLAYFPRRQQGVSQLI